jgi:hypothetical protein
VRRLKSPQGEELLTCKRNRGITIIKIDKDALSVQEQGYEENSFQVRLDNLPGLLRATLQNCFSESRCARLPRPISSLCVKIYPPVSEARDSEISTIWLW